MDQQPIPTYALTDISNKLSQLIEAELINATLQKKILQEILDRRDEGKAIYANGLLSLTQFTVIDLVEGTEQFNDFGGSPGHPVKGYSVKNTGTTNILFAHNITKQAQLDLDVTLDSLKANPIFSTLVPNEVENVRFNINCIRSVHLLALTGPPATTSSYKIKFVW